MNLVNQFFTLINLDTTKENDVYYYVIVQRWLFLILAFYYVVHLGICMGYGFRKQWIITGIFLALAAAAFYFTYRYSDVTMLFWFVFMIVGWVGFSIYSFGWGIGSQHFLLLILVMVFFCVHFTKTQKICWMLGVLIIRILFFIFCERYVPQLQMGDIFPIIIQVLGSLTLFASMSVSCISFSSNIQASEIRLINANQSLREQANTDQLTKLANRRYMISSLNEWIVENPNSMFTVAMADIDFFKKVNDTWGHECGDEVLKTLAGFFRENMKDKGLVCRWGGEEFLLFFPYMNVDEAAYACEMMNIKIRQLKVNYKDQVIQITMTFGVEEADYGNWDLSSTVEKADEKLYIGKQQGRNQVVA